MSNPASEAPDADTDVVGADNDGATTDVPVPVQPLTADSGFIEVPPEPTTFLGIGRMFYSFQPAMGDHAEQKPLLVFFNGGPGSATSTVLLSYGTGRFTLPRRSVAGDPVQENPRSFARFANLLSVDARNTGFSYELRPTAPPRVGGGESFLLEDTADFVRALLRFLAAHPTLRRAPVVLVGESYGGIRAVSMLRMLLHYRDLDVAVPDDLRQEIQEHCDALFPADGSAGLHSASQIARQFAHTVLIQPLLGGKEQQTIQWEMMPRDPYLGPYLATASPDTRSNYDVREPASWSDDVATRALNALADENSSPSLLQFDLGRVEAFLPTSRANAWGSPSWMHLSTASEAKFRDRYGALGADDRYLTDFAGPDLFSASFGPADDPRIFGWFVDLLRYSRFLLTNARYDMVIHTPSIPELLTRTGISTVVDQAPRPNVARPGWIKVISSDASKEFEIRFPTYDDSGHMITVSQGPELADDVGEFLNEQ